MAYSVASTDKLKDQVILVALDSTGVSSNEQPAGYTILADDGREYQFVLNDSSGVACVAGAPVVWQKTTTDYVVTPDLSDNDQMCPGVACAILTDAYYGWIQTKGLVEDAIVCSAVSSGDPLYATSDGFFDTATIGTHHIVAVAMEDYSASGTDVMLL